MTITRRGKCHACGVPCREKRDFHPTTDMFNPGVESINHSISADVKAWRDSPIYCDDHKI